MLYSDEVEPVQTYPHEFTIGYQDPNSVLEENSRTDDGCRKWTDLNKNK